ncbi:Rhs element Vgr protein [Paraburkholderia piptadeniae]|uniref:Rhs element Vgr protein n=1 Tax=Paraburkholderia piptadeniae TaxID=1701573 RepID=A0A1N7SR38_9BURK|nr:type VI secretion system tip protein TssI/VgrG [Paraburkholderia piptadeniae]SIT49892.1 Rhs element Vgr protein [Paraburkholderia piptadeniae]
MLTFLQRRTLTISGPALPLLPDGAPALLLSAIRGEESLSTVYGYELFLTTPLGMPDAVASTINLKALAGTELTVTIQLDGMGTFAAGESGLAGRANIGAGTREISGLVMEAGFVGKLNRQYRYRVLLQPWPALMALCSDFRIYQRKTVVDILETVFGAYLYSYDLRLSRTYPVLDYQVQYGETDLHFAQRLMAEHGIYWFIEHSDTFHRMVLVDHLGAHKAVESAAYQTLWYYPPGHKIDREYIDHFDTTERIQTGIWTTNDYHFKKPKAQLQAQNELPQDTAHNQLERYEWPGDYTEPADGEQFARVRMEELYAHGERASGKGNVRNVVCGTTFTLTGHPQASANREYLVLRSALEAEEVGESSGVAAHYRIATKFDVQPATTVFRPERKFAKPRTTGPQTAIVTGAPGSEIWTDQYGRVKLAFHWDRHGPKDHNSSCWIRVSYPWAGSNFGGIHIPRVGTEVIVDFENGDPDRPIVIGRVYNAMTMPPWDLPGNATQSGILTRSSKDGGYGNANAIRFEDRKGAEELWLQAERDMRTEVENDESHAVRHDRMKTIENDESTTIGHDRSETVGHDEQVDIRHDRRHRIGEDAFLEVGRNHTSQIGKDRIEQVGNHRKDQITANYLVEIGGHSEHKVQGHHQLEAGQLAGVKSRVIQLQAGDVTKISGPAGTITLDGNGITLEAVRITLKGPIQSSTGWVKNALDLRSDDREGLPFDLESFSFSG